MASTQASIGGAIFGTGLGTGVGSQVAGPGSGVPRTGSITDQAVAELAYTGVSHTTLMLVAGAILVLLGMLIMGLARRHPVRHLAPG